MFSHPHIFSLASLPLASLFDRVSAAHPLSILPTASRPSRLLIPTPDSPAHPPPRRPVLNHADPRRATPLHPPTTATDPAQRQPCPPPPLPPLHPLPSPTHASPLPLSTTAPALRPGHFPGGLRCAWGARRLARPLPGLRPLHRPAPLRCARLHALVHGSCPHPFAPHQRGLRRSIPSLGASGSTLIRNLESASGSMRRRDLAPLEQPTLLV